MDITQIPIDELIADKKESEDDSVMCAGALLMGIYAYGNNESVERRIFFNQNIISMIDAELQRRQQEAQPA